MCYTWGIGQKLQHLIIFNAFRNCWMWEQNYQHIIDSPFLKVYSFLISVTLQKSFIYPPRSRKTPSLRCRLQVGETNPRELWEIPLWICEKGLLSVRSRWIPHLVFPDFLTLQNILTQNCNRKFLTTCRKSNDWQVSEPGCKNKTNTKSNIYNGSNYYNVTVIWVYMSVF